jgi:DNA-binding transcriptional LysR family regulator
MPVTHPQAVSATISLDRLLPERLVVLPPDTNPAFHSAIVSLCRAAGCSPTLVEVAEPRVEHVLLAVASGAGMALLPESAAERHVSPGVRFVPLEDPEPAFAGVVLTRPGADDLATAAFVRAVAHAARPVAVPDPARSPAPAISLVA